MGGEAAARCETVFNAGLSSLLRVDLDARRNWAGGSPN